MGSTKHEKSFVDFDKPYEQNLIGLRGVAYFGIGLFLLVVITFGLMAFLLNVLEDQAVQTDNADRNPMQLSEKDRLPNGPRLQSAPGFGVETEDGFVNLELKNPQAEWEIIHEEYKKIWKDGHKGNDKIYTVLPIEEAKKKYLEQNAAKPASSTNEQTQKVMEESRKFVSDSSSGRLASETRR